MIIDDDEDDCEFFCEAVKQIDVTAECIFHYKSEDALLELRQNMEQLPDFIFLDLNMPRFDGREFLAAVNIIDKLKGITVIIYSTSSSMRERKETRDLGVSYYLTKPTDLNKLKEEIINIMEQQWVKLK